MGWHLRIYIYYRFLGDTKSAGLGDSKPAGLQPHLENHWKTLPVMGMCQGRFCICSLRIGNNCSILNADENDLLGKN